MVFIYRDRAPKPGREHSARRLSAERLVFKVEPELGERPRRLLASLDEDGENDDQGVVPPEVFYKDPNKMGIGETFKMLTFMTAGFVIGAGAGALIGLLIVGSTLVNPVGVPIFVSLVSGAFALSGTWLATYSKAFN